MCLLQETGNAKLRHEIDDLRRKKLQQRRIRQSMVTRLPCVMLCRGGDVVFSPSTAGVGD